MITAKQAQLIINNKEKFFDCFPRLPTKPHTFGVQKLFKTIKTFIDPNYKKTTKDIMAQKVFEWENETKLDQNEDRRIKFSSLWTKIFTMYSIVSNGVTGDDEKEIYDNWNTQADETLTNFLELHDGFRCRIYLHILFSHGKDLLEIYGPLRWLSNQGCEAANGRDTSNFFSFTAKGGGRLTKDMTERARGYEKKDIMKSNAIKKVISRPFLKAQLPTPQKVQKINFSSTPHDNFNNSGSTRQEIYAKNNGLKPICTFGKYCYRNSESHVNEYIHDVRIIDSANDSTSLDSPTLNTSKHIVQEYSDDEYGAYEDTPNFISEETSSDDLLL